VVVVAAHRDGRLIDVDNVVAHELAHIALGAALRGRAPRWLNEGLAYLHSSDFSMARARTLSSTTAFRPARTRPRSPTPRATIWSRSWPGAAAGPTPTTTAIGRRSSASWARWRGNQSNRLARAFEALARRRLGTAPDRIDQEFVCSQSYIVHA
jgi:hypothetical protein